jgi:hypothetical protein
MSLLMVVLGSLAAWAQSGPEVHVQHIGGMSVQSVNEVEVPEGADTALSITAAGFTVPLVPIRLVDDHWVMVFLADFEVSRLRFEGDLSAGVDNRDLYQVRLAYVNAVQVTDRLGAMLLVQPGLYTDFGGGMTSDDVGVALSGLGTWDVSDTFTTGLGAGYIWVFGRPRWAPLLQLDVHRERLLVDVLLPRGASMWWNAKGRLWLGAEAELDGGFYRVHAEDTDQAHALFQEYSRQRIGGGARLKLKDKLIVELTGSVVPWTVVSTWEDADTELFELTLSPGWSVVGQITLDVGR